MKQKVELFASILSEDIGNYQTTLNRLKGIVNWVQLDVMDNIFVPRYTFNWQVVEKLKPPGSMQLEAHLMTAKPEQSFFRYAEAGCTSILYHIEAWDNLERHQSSVEELAKQDVRLGVAISPDTPIETVFPFLDHVNKILVMTVRPGLGGQDFMPEMLQKVREVRARFDGDIQVDGGIKKSTIRQAVEAGANQIVVGTGLMEGDLKENKEKLLAQI